jgi:hypothetical protein
MQAGRMMLISLQVVENQRNRTDVEGCCEGRDISREAMPLTKVVITDPRDVARAKTIARVWVITIPYGSMACFHTPITWQAVERRRMNALVRPVFNPRRLGRGHPSYVDQLAFQEKRTGRPSSGTTGRKCIGLDWDPTGSTRQRWGWR